MAEVLATYENPVVAPDGTVYRVQACGAEAVDGTDRWEGWVEFLPIGGGTPLRSRRETTQPNRKDTAYWASGLSPVYLEGTLERTLSGGPAAPVVAKTEPVFDGPSRPGAVPIDPETPSVLNPFSVYRKSEAMLRNQLGALSAWHLVNIIKAYELSDLTDTKLERAAHADLVELIVAAVKLRAAGESR